MTSEQESQSPPAATTAADREKYLQEHYSAAFAELHAVLARVAAQAAAEADPYVYTDVVAVALRHVANELRCVRGVVFGWSEENPAGWWHRHAFGAYYTGQVPPEGMEERTCLCAKCRQGMVALLRDVVEEAALTPERLGVLLQGRADDAARGGREVVAPEHRQPAHVEADLA